MPDRWATTDQALRRFGQDRHNEDRDLAQAAILSVLNVAIDFTTADYQVVSRAVAGALERFDDQ